MATNDNILSGDDVALMLSYSPAIPSPEATNSVPAGPLTGGRVYAPGPRRRPGQRTLAVFDTKANLIFTSSGNAGQAATDTADVTDSAAPFGSSVVRVTPRAGLEVRIAPTAPLTTVCDVSSGGYIKIHFKPISNMIQFDVIDRWAVELHSAGTPTSPTLNYHTMHILGEDLGGILTGGISAGRWQSQGISIGELYTVNGNPYSLSSNQVKDGATGGADLTQIKFVRLFIMTKSGQTPLQVELSHIEYIPNALTKAACIIGFDDAHTLDYALPIMQKYGFPGVVYPSPASSYIGNFGRLNKEQLIMLQDLHGWQVASQSYIDEDSVRFDSMREDERTAEFAKLRNWHNGLGLSGGAHGSYYSNVSATDITAFPAFRRNFRSIRRFDSPFGAGHPIQTTEMYPWRDPYNIRAVNAAGFTGASDWTTRHKLGVDAAIAVKGVHWALFHNELATAGQVRTNFESFLTYLDAQRANIEVVTEDYLVRTHG